MTAYHSGLNFKQLILLISLSIGCSAGNGEKTSRTDSDNQSGGSHSSKSKRCLNLVNGTKTGDFPSVYQIATINLKTNAVGGCTGTFVSDNTFITAAHCIPCNPKELPIRLMGNTDTISYQLTREDLESKPQALNVFMSDQNYCDGKALNPWRPDVAIVIFPPKTTNKYAVLAKERLPETTPVTLVGYGMTDKTMLSNPEAKNTKRYGYNQLITRPSTVAPAQPEAYEIIGRGRTSSSDTNGIVATDTMGVHGDSGSPLFKRDSDTIIGILSGGTTVDQRYSAYQKNGNEDLVNFYTDANSQSVKNLIAQATAAGGKVIYEGDPRPIDDNANTNDDLASSSTDDQKDKLTSNSKNKKNSKKSSKKTSEVEDECADNDEES